MIKVISTLILLLLATVELFAQADTLYVDAKNKVKAVFITKTSAGVTNGFDVSRVSPHKHTVQWITTGGPATCTIELEGSLQGTTGPWSSLSGSQVCTSSGMFHVTERSVDYIRVNLTALTGGTSPTVTIAYMGKW